MRVNREHSNNNALRPERGANNKSIGQIRWPTLLWDQSQHNVPQLPALYPPPPSFLCTPEGGKQTKLSLVTGDSRERETGGDEGAGQIIFFVLCGKCFYFAFFIYIFTLLMVLLCPKWARESGVGKFACQLFFRLFYHVLLPVLYISPGFFFFYFMLCLLAGMWGWVYVCVCVCATTQTGSNMQIKQRPSATSIKWERDTKAREHRRRRRKMGETNRKPRWQQQEEGWATRLLPHQYGFHVPCCSYKMKGSTADVLPEEWRGKRGEGSKHGLKRRRSNAIQLKLWHLQVA